MFMLNFGSHKMMVLGLALERNPRWHWGVTMALSSIKWTWKVPSSMDQSRKRSMLSNLPALKIVSTLTMSINSLRRFTGSNKPHEHGMNALEIFLSLMASKSERPILLYLLKLLTMICLYAKYMLMISYLGLLTNLHVKNLVGSWHKNSRCLWWGSWSIS